MKPPLTARLALSLLALFCFAAAADAHEFKLGALTIVDPSSRPTAGKTGAVYMTIENAGGEADRLVSVATIIAAKAELHTVTLENNIMLMRPVEGIDVPAGGKAVLRTGGFHVMLIGVKKLVEGDKFPLTLTFAKAGKVEVEAIVGKLGAPAGHRH